MNCGWTQLLAFCRVRRKLGNLEYHRRSRNNWKQQRQVCAHLLLLLLCLSSRIRGKYSACVGRGPDPGTSLMCSQFVVLKGYEFLFVWWYLVSLSTLFGLVVSLCLLLTCSLVVLNNLLKWIKITLSRKNDSEWKCELTCFPHTPSLTSFPFLTRCGHGAAPWFAMALIFPDTLRGFLYSRISRHGI